MKSSFLFYFKGSTSVFPRCVALSCLFFLNSGCRNPALTATSVATPSEGAQGGAAGPEHAGSPGMSSPDNTQTALPPALPPSSGTDLQQEGKPAAVLPPRPSGWSVVKALPTLDVLMKEGAGVRMFLARIVLASHPVRIAHTSGSLKSTRALTSNCKIGVNTGYFSGPLSMSLIATGGNVVMQGITQLRRGGVNKFPSRGALSVTKDRARVGWAFPRAGKVFVFDAPQSLASVPSGGAAWDADFIMGGGPVLLKGGQSRVTWQQELFDGESGIGPTVKNPRTAAGTDSTGGLLYLLVSDGRSWRASGHTLAGLAGVLRELGATEAVNFDGGGSSTFVLDGRVINSPSDGSERAVYSALCVN